MNSLAYETFGGADIPQSAVIISSLDHVEEACKRFSPSHVLSILDKEEPTPPAFAELSAENHLRLIENCSRNADNNIITRCEKLIGFAKKWSIENHAKPADEQRPLLIHCHQGVARSTAAAYIILCTVQSEKCEKLIAAELRAHAPHAEPNLLLVSEADAALGRSDRMVEAILDLCPSSATVTAPIVTLPVAA